jgi:predicted nucleotide-binding protein
VFRNASTQPHGSRLSDATDLTRTAKDEQYDFFISYTAADMAWAEWIAWQLEKEGYTVFLQSWDIRPGADWVVKIRQAMEGTTRTIAVLSAAYLRSQFGESEWRVAFQKDPSGEKGLLIPVRVEEVSAPGLLASRVYIDLVGQDEQEARRQLLRGVDERGARPTHEPKFPGRLSRTVVSTLANPTESSKKRGETISTNVEPSQVKQAVEDPRKVVVVYGRNEPARRATFDFLRALDLRPLEWGELVLGTGVASPYIGQVLDHAFATAQAVVVLFTPDDEARLREPLRKEDEPSHEVALTGQPRPNVIFEAGMAFGLHPERTVLLSIGYSRPVSDLSGRHEVRFDGSQRALRDVARRLKETGCPVNQEGDDWTSVDRFREALAIARGSGS